MTAFSRPSELSELTHRSAQIGSDIRWVQGGGGNASLKQDEVLWIKASGTWLAEALDRDIFIPLSLPRVNERLGRGEDNCADGTALTNDPRRASIETALHALMPHRVVFHVHCVDTLRWCVLADGEARLGDRLRRLNWLWISYRRPGAPLAGEVAHRLKTSQEVPDILVLQNHGLVVGADSSDAALARLETVRELLAAAERTIQTKVPRAAAPSDYDWTDDPLLMNLAFDATARRVARGGILYPDHAVFLGAAFSEIREDESAGDALARGHKMLGEAPAYLVAPNEGVLLSKRISRGARAMLQCLALVCSRISTEDLDTRRVRYLSTADVAALLNWDAEVYRQQIALQMNQV
jgi:rhamnose utilization protein RhaD (predicted bifunctional aldolase and dehydrogenase)